MEPVALFLIVAIVATIMFRNDEHVAQTKSDLESPLCNNLDWHKEHCQAEYTKSTFSSIALMIFLVIVGLFLFAGMTGGN